MDATSRRFLSWAEISNETLPMELITGNSLKTFYGITWPAIVQVGFVAMVLIA